VAYFEEFELSAHTLGVLLCSVVAAACGQILFKMGATGRTSFVDFLNAWNFSGGVAYLLSTVLWIYALSKTPLTVVYPFTALTFVLAYAAGAFLFDEAVSLASISGVLLILLGLFLTTRY